VGIGIYVNGKIKHQENAPIINLSDTVKITSTGNGIYAAGYSTYNINGAYIEGVEAGLAIKSGVFNILDGTIFGTGEDKTPTSGNNNGINPSGAGIQMESNVGYKGDIELSVKDGTIRSKQGNSIYEYVVNSSPTKVKKISLSGGNYLSDVGKDTIRISTQMEGAHPTFVKGGTYSSDPTKYLASGYSVVKNSNTSYEVVSSTMSVFNESSNDSKTSTVLLILMAIILIGLAVVAFLKRERILTFLRNGH